ncbi:sodium:proton antiporter NhaD [Blattabacterium cuenoti]|uniref:sodium:proton antiporter NhaD n=1 Tax=Blattabacterium cuenoti TaxID=1653831 RepID=UPI00163C6957|nr:sodium:proton antiporter NhaD [Blattabacterium cuenoti]
MIILIFIIGYLFIVFENFFSLNKTISSILMSVICWSIIIFFNKSVYDLDQYLMIKKDPQNLLLLHLGKASEIIFFLIGTMSIVSIIDKFSAFDALKELLHIDTKRKLLWKISFLSFFLSAIIDNLTTSIVLISLLRKIINKCKERLYYLGIVIISANAGGVWSPIGDITTTMLWISKKVTTIQLIKRVFIPSILCMLISTCIASCMSVFDGPIKQNREYKNLSKKNIQIGFHMLKIGIFLMLLVPIYKTIIGIPPYMGIMFSLGILLCIVLSKKYRNQYSYLNINELFQKLDISSILFFFGILLSVSSLEVLGILYHTANWINNVVPTWKITTFLFGLISSIIDNVPLVAASISMFYYSIDHELWHFIAYVSGTGGSLFLIGSASGVAVMGMEKISFFWYVKKISWIALIGYISGFIYLLLEQFIF